MLIEEDRELDWEKLKKLKPIPYTISKDRELLYGRMHSPNIIETDLHGILVLEKIDDLLKLAYGTNMMISDPNDYMIKFMPEPSRFSEAGQLKCDDCTLSVVSKDWTVFNVRFGNVWGSILRVSDDLTVSEIKDVIGNIFNSFKDNGFPINRLLSPPKMAERILRQTTSTIMFPDFSNGDIPEEVIYRAYQCFRGGRMEAASLGKFMDAYDYDMIRAYYSVLRTLPSIRSGFFDWIDSKEYIDGAFFGFCLCEIDVPDNAPIGPVGVRIEVSPRPPRTFFPTGKQISWRTKTEIDMLLQYNLAKVKILEGSWGVPKRELYLLFSGAAKIIEALMNDDRSKNYAKYISSTSWGKLASPESTLCNYIYASYITSEVRCATTKLAIPNSEHLIALAVDGLSLDKEIKDSKFVSNNIGGLRCNIIGQMLSLADFYRYNPEEKKPGWHLGDEGIVIRVKSTPFRSEGEFIIPFGSTKRLNPENLNLDMLMEGQFKLRPPTPEEVVEIYFTEEDKFPGTVNWF